MGRTDPWREFAERHREDDRLAAPITRTTDFGILVGLEGGIEGIVHLDDISWSEAGEAAIKRFAEGDMVEVMILSIDVERQRVSLGIKQIDNPYDAFAERYPVGADVLGRVREIGPRRLVVDLPGGLPGVVYLDDDGFSEGRFAVGDELRVVVIEIWARHGMIQLGLDDDGDDGSAVPIEPGKPPSPRPLPTSRRQ